MGDFDGRAAVVLGGSSGFGLSIARRLRDGGAQVLIAARDRERLEEAAREIGAECLVCDVTSDSDLQALASAAHERFGRLDVAVNSAGFEQQTPLRDLTPELLEPMVAVQFTGAVYFIRHMANAMQAGGSVITLSSLTATLVPENYAAYAGSKAGINHVTRIAAAEYGPQGVRVNTVGPSLIETPLTAHLLAIPAVRAAFLEETPLGRLGTTEDVAQAVTWLASDAASYITGQNLVIDGGASLRRLPTNRDVMRHLSVPDAGPGGE